MQTLPQRVTVRVWPVPAAVEPPFQPPASDTVQVSLIAVSPSLWPTGIVNLVYTLLAAQGMGWRTVGVRELRIN